MNADPLDRLFQAARESTVDTSRLQIAFETRLLARLRDERRDSWFTWALRLCPYCAAIAAAACAWTWYRGETTINADGLLSAVRLAGRPALEFYLGGE